MVRSREGDCSLRHQEPPILCQAQQPQTRVRKSHFRAQEGRLLRHCLDMHARACPLLPVPAAPQNTPPSPTCSGISSCMLLSGGDRESLAAGSGSSHGPAMPELRKFGSALCSVLAAELAGAGPDPAGTHSCAMQSMPTKCRTITSAFLTPVEQAEPDCNSFHNSHMQMPL